MIYLLRKALSKGIKKVFALTTHTAHWFLEKGFKEVSIQDLPLSKQKSIDVKRNSKVYMIDISLHRAIDEQELLAPE